MAHTLLPPTNQPKQLSNRALDDALLALVAQERACIADILAHLAEVDRRKMYVADGFASLFRYAVEHLHMTEAAAGHRITAARLLARFPQIYANGVKLHSPESRLSRALWYFFGVTVSYPEGVSQDSRYCQTLTEYIWLEASFTQGALRDLGL